MRFLTRASVAVAGLAATVALAGCGSSGGTLLTADAASALNADLTQASRALSLGNCEQASTAMLNFKSDVAQLTNVNSTLVTMLNQGADTISSLAEDRCPTGSTTTTKAKTTTTATATQPVTTTTETESTPTVTTTPAVTITTVTSDTSGGATPGGGVTSTPAQTTTTPPAVTTTTPDSGGAGLGGSNGGAGVGNT